MSNRHIHWLVLALLVIAQTVAAKTVSVQEGNRFESAWKRFQASQGEARPAMKFPYEHCFRRASAAHGLSLPLLLAVARGESDFDPSARSDANAWGLMQIQWPGTAQHLGIKRQADLLDPCLNVDAGARYLKELLARYDGNLHRALAAYNYGPGRINREGSVPGGAAWYSGYIYRHLTYVTGERDFGTQPPPANYAEERKLEIMVFNRPYRAEAFVNSMQDRSKALRLDWFDKGFGRYAVVLLYRNRQELEQEKRIMKSLGIRIL